MSQRRGHVKMISKICPVCGKEFFPGPDWVYKNFEGIYCTWGCKRKREKNLKLVDGDGILRKGMVTIQ